MMSPGLCKQQQVCSSQQALVQAMVRLEGYDRCTIAIVGVSGMAASHLAAGDAAQAA